MTTALIAAGLLVLGAAVGLFGASLAAAMARGDRQAAIELARLQHDELPAFTIYSNGYALLVRTPTGPVAVELSYRDADVLGDHGLNYLELVSGELLDALQAIDGRGE